MTKTEKSGIKPMELVREAGLSLGTARKLLSGTKPSILLKYAEAARVIAKRTGDDPLNVLAELVGLEVGNAKKPRPK